MTRRHNYRYNADLRNKEEQPYINKFEYLSKFLEYIPYQN